MAESCPSMMWKSSAGSGWVRRKRHQKPGPTVWHRGVVTAFYSKLPLLELPPGGAPSGSGALLLPPEACVCFGHGITVAATSPCQGTTARRGATTKQQPPKPKSRRCIAELALHIGCDSDATATVPMTAVQHGTALLDLEGDR